jgi:hypothetical protein
MRRWRRVEIPRGVRRHFTVGWRRYLVGLEYQIGSSRELVRFAPSQSHESLWTFQR